MNHAEARISRVIKSRVIKSKRLAFTEDQDDSM